MPLSIWVGASGTAAGPGPAPLLVSGVPVVSGVAIT